MATNIHRGCIQDLYPLMREPAYSLPILQVWISHLIRHNWNWDTGTGCSSRVCPIRIRITCHGQESSGKWKRELPFSFFLVIHKPLMELHESLKSVLEDPKVLDYFSILEKILQWLDDLRDNLRITRKNNLKDSKPSDIELDKILIKIKEVLLKIRTESWKLDKQYQLIASTIIDAFESHWEELFVPDPIVNGRKISFRRHNNGLESSHRRIRKGIRERTGKSETNSEMEQFGDLLAILSNLWNETYQKEILQDVVDIGRSLSPFVKDLPRLRQEYRETRRGTAIPIDDEERLDILENFIEIFENNELDSVLISSLQSILKLEGCSEII